MYNLDPTYTVFSFHFIHVEWMSTQQSLGSRESSKAVSGPQCFKNRPNKRGVQYRFETLFTKKPPTDEWIHVTNDHALPRFLTPKVTDAHAQCQRVGWTCGRRDTGHDWMLVPWQHPPAVIPPAGRSGRAGDRRRGDRWMAWTWNRQTQSRNTQSTSSHLAKWVKLKRCFMCGRY